LAWLYKVHDDPRISTCRENWMAGGVGWLS
jgi:hypothetical protein